MTTVNPLLDVDLVYGVCSCVNTQYTIYVINPENIFFKFSCIVFVKGLANNGLTLFSVGFCCSILRKTHFAIIWLIFFQNSNFDIAKAEDPSA